MLKFDTEVLRMVAASGAVFWWIPAGIGLLAWAAIKDAKQRRNEMNNGKPRSGK
jgi:hypothetical protein